jgi:tRNA U38,U39,U40 pseudouridine synthase TruA
MAERLMRKQCEVHKAYDVHTHWHARLAELTRSYSIRISLEPDESSRLPHLNPAPLEP